VHGLRRDGTLVPLEIGLSPIEMPDGDFMLATLIDITERKQRDDELRRSNADLEQFAYIASHDLQEPLRMVASYTELLEERYKGRLDERADKYIFYAVDGAKRMQRLVADLLAFSRVGSQGKPLKPVDTAAVLAEVLRVLGPRLREAGADVQADPLPPVMADEDQLFQLLQNLVGNALKFRSEAPPRIRISAVREGDAWRFAVADNGIGIEPQYSERIFQMFQRLHERGRYEGSGIGLSIVKRILERHGGRIWLQSTPGQGSTFFFTLPALAPTAEGR
jgi:light-regulated signal transduction histidine kinase (bacteriophytochrome)